MASVAKLHPRMADKDPEERRKRHLEVHEDRMEYHDRRKNMATVVALLPIALVIVIFLLGIVSIDLMLLLLLGALIGYCVHSFKVHAAKVGFHQRLADRWRGDE